MIRNRVLRELLPLLVVGLAQMDVPAVGVLELERCARDLLVAEGSLGRRIASDDLAYFVCHASPIL